MMQLRLRGQRSGHGHRVNRRWQTIPAPVPSCAPSRINSSTQASGLVPLSTAGQGRVTAPAALPKPLIIPSGGRRVLGLGFGGHPGGCGLSSALGQAPRGPVGRKGAGSGRLGSRCCGAGQPALPDTSLPGSFPLLRATTTCIPEPSPPPLVRGESAWGHGPHCEHTEAQGQAERLTPVAEAELREPGLQQPRPGPLFLWNCPPPPPPGILQARILFLPQGNLPDPGIEPASLVPPASVGGCFTAVALGKPQETMCIT